MLGRSCRAKGILLHASDLVILSQEILKQSSAEESDEGEYERACL